MQALFIEESVKDVADAAVGGLWLYIHVYLYR